MYIEEGEGTEAVGSRRTSIWRSVSGDHSRGGGNREPVVADGTAVADES